MRATTAGLALLAALAGVAPASAAAQEPTDRYALVRGCYELQAGGRTVAGPVRMQATALGRYLLYTTDRRFLAASGDGIAPAAAPSASADWRVDEAEGGFTLSLPDAGGRTLVARDGGPALGGPGQGSTITFAKADGCPEYPEVESNVDGTPPAAPTSYQSVYGTMDGHLHHMAYEFLGGKVHCGAPWHRYGAPFALPDCSEDTLAGLANRVADPVLGGDVLGDPKGWPSFSYWPNHHALVYEQTYWKWMERAWKGGLRLMVNLFVDNEALCNIYPVKQNPCNDMNSVRLQHRRIHALQDYIDAQYGGPGKGFYRIVKSPFEARRVINEGKMAVVLGIEVSRLFECGVINDVPQCTKEDVDARLQEVYDLGVRGMELVNKFDNAFSGVAGDSGVIGPLVNAANFASTGSFWKMQTCNSSDGHAHDRPQDPAAGTDRDALFSNLVELIPGGVLPVYPAKPHCNVRGLTQLGEHLVKRMMEKGMIIDPDHMSQVGREQLLNLVEAKRYPGVISSHSWSDEGSLPRIYATGGVVTPMAGNASGFVREWRSTKRGRSDKFHFGFGYGADMNGFAGQGGPRSDAGEKPLTYPFKTPEGLTVHKQRSGQREFDLNKDGVAHYGLFADFLQDLKVLAGDEIVTDMMRGAEAYLQTWERAQGIKPEECRGDRGTFGRAGLAKLKLGDTPEAVLRAAGQPRTRKARTFTYCVARRPGKKGARGLVRGVFGADGKLGLVTSTAPGHRVRGIAPGAKASRVRGLRTFGPGLRIRDAGKGRRYVIGLRKGRVRFIAVASRSASKTSKRLRSELRRAGL